MMRYYVDDKEPKNETTCGGSEPGSCRVSSKGMGQKTCQCGASMPLSFYGEKKHQPTGNVEVALDG